MNKLVKEAEELVETLKRCKQVHYDGGIEGLTACNKRIHPEMPCDCGADLLNAEIDEWIEIIAGSPTAEEPVGVLKGSEITRLERP